MKGVSVQLGAAMLVAVTISLGLIFMNFSDRISREISESVNITTSTKYSLEECRYKNKIFLRKSEFPHITTKSVVEDFKDWNKIDYAENITVDVTLGVIMLSNITENVYKMRININNSHNNFDLIDFQIVINLTYHPAMYLNFSDIRFYYLNRSDGKEHKTYYYLRRYHEGSWAEFVVKIPRIEANYENETLYAYFGNKSLWYSESDYSRTMEIPPVKVFRYLKDFTGGRDIIHDIAINNTTHILVGTGSASSTLDGFWFIAEINRSDTITIELITSKVINPTPYIDEPISLNIDSKGNIIIVGYDTPVIGDSRWRIMKFYPNWSIMWSHTYNFSPGEEIADDVVIDKNDNIIVVGFDSIPGNAQWRIMKFYPNGTEIWNRTFDFSNGNDEIHGVVIDNESNIIAVGWDESSGQGNAQWRIMKFYPNGTEIWNRTFDFSPNSDGAHRVAIDKEGNYVIVGWDNVLNEPQVRVMKFYPNGTEIWNYSINLQASNSIIETGYDVDIDENNSYIISTWFGGGLIKLYPNGTLDWYRVWGSSYGFRGIKVDSYIKRYASAIEYKSSTNAKGYRMLVSYDKNAYTTNTILDSTGNDRLDDVDIDSQGNYVITGWVSYNMSYYSIIEKYHPNGTLIWRYEDKIPNYNVYLHALEIDKENNVIAVGSVEDEAYNEAWRIVKVYHNGSLMWNKTIDFSTKDDAAHGVVVDSENNIIVVGWDESPGNGQWRIMKYYPNGTLIWEYTEDLSSSDDEAYDVDIDSENNIIVGGWDVLGSGGFFFSRSPRWRIMKFYPNGSVIWTYTSDPSSGNDYIFGIKVDKEDNIIAVGTDYIRNNYQIRAEKIYSNGTLHWVYTESIDPPDSAFEVSVDIDQNYILTAYQAQFGRWYIFKLYNSNGSKAWGYLEDVNPSGRDVPGGIAIDEEGNYIIVGHYEEVNDRGDGHMILKLSPLKNIENAPNISIDSAVSSPTGSLPTYHTSGLFQTINILLNSTPAYLKILQLDFLKLKDLVDIYISPDNTTYKKITLDSNQRYVFTSSEKDWKSLFIRIVLNSTSDQKDTPVVDRYTLVYKEKPNESIKVLLYNPTHLNLSINNILVRGKSSGEYCNTYASKSNIPPKASHWIRIQNCTLNCNRDEVILKVYTECGELTYNLCDGGAGI